MVFAKDGRVGVQRITKKITEKDIFQLFLSLILLLTGQVASKPPGPSDKRIDTHSREEIVGGQARFKEEANSRCELGSVWLGGKTEQAMIMVDMIIRGGFRDRMLGGVVPLNQQWISYPSTLTSWKSRQKRKNNLLPTNIPNRPQRSK